MYGFIFHKLRLMGTLNASHDEYSIDDIDAAEKEGENNNGNCWMSEVYVSNPDTQQGETKVPFGAKLKTMKVDRYLFQILFDIEKGGIADQFHVK